MSASVCVYRCHAGVGGGRGAGGAHAPLGFECYSPLLAATAGAQESSVVL